MGQAKREGRGDKDSEEERNPDPDPDRTNRMFTHNKTPLNTRAYKEQEKKGRRSDRRRGGRTVVVVDGGGPERRSRSRIGYGGGRVRDEDRVRFTPKKKGFPPIVQVTKKPSHSI